MINKVYIVKIMSGQPYETSEYEKFVTLDKIKAENWVNKYNNIIERHKDRISAFMESEEFYKCDKDFYTYEYIYYENPTAYTEEIELR